MSQYDPTAYVDTESGTAHVTRHNNVGGALLSSHSSTSRPSYAAAGTVWLDNTTTPWVINEYDGSDDIYVATVNASTNEYIPYQGSQKGETMWASNGGPLVQDSTALFTWDGSDLLWTGHFYAKFGGDGTHWATDGYYTIDCPTSGTVTGVGGASNQTATASGIPLAADEALYYIPTANAANTFVQANLRIVKLGADFTIGPHWIFIAGVDGLGGIILGNGGYLPKWNTPTLLNSWSAQVYSQGYGKTPDGNVYLRIRATGGTTTDGTTLLTLPQYFRPDNTIHGGMSCTTSGSMPPFVRIYNTGNVDIYGAAGVIFVHAIFTAAN